MRYRKLLMSCTSQNRCLTRGTGCWPVVTWPLGPWHGLTFRAAGSASHFLYLWSAGMMRIALCPKMISQGSNFLVAPVWPMVF